MNSNYSCSISIEQTDQNNIFNIFHLNKFIGQYMLIHDGIFFTKRNEIFYKYMGFGIIKDLFTDARINFKIIIVKFNGKKYLSTRQNFIDNSIKHSFKFGEMLFLPLSMFEKTSDQLDLFERT